MVRKTQTVGVVDYGMGNLHSVAKAIAYQGANVVVSDSRRKLQACDLLVLPGVGSFGAAMISLSRKQLDDFIRSWISEKKPYLGMCLGLQLLFERSEEDPATPGLSVFRGNVIRFRQKDFAKGQYRVPHMGWNTVDLREKTRALLFKGLTARDYFYFVHTFYAVPEDDAVIAGRTTYGKKFCSSVSSENVFATQFHPEKSGVNGGRLLKNVMDHYRRQATR